MPFYIDCLDSAFPNHCDQIKLFNSVLFAVCVNVERQFNAVLICAIPRNSITRLAFPVPAWFIVSRVRESSSTFTNSPWFVSLSVSDRENVQHLFSSDSDTKSRACLWQSAHSHPITSWLNYDSTAHQSTGRWNSQPKAIKSWFVACPSTARHTRARRKRSGNSLFASLCRVWESSRVKCQ